jgi:uncharacterized beta-barrel protein YwiB (DUF1934 family)
MINKILITVIGRQKYDEHCDKIELTTTGTIKIKDDCYIINYKEEQEPSVEPINVEVKIKKDESSVEMIRSGSFSSCLVIEKSKRNLCQYGTEYGNVLMGIFGRTIEASVGDTEGSFVFAYDIDINGASTSKNEVVINYHIN